MIYRSGVGLLIYLLKHSIPELSNTVRELFKCMDEVNMSHYKDFLRAIKYIINTNNYLYQMKPDVNINVPW